MFFLRIPDVVRYLAKTGKVICWDVDKYWFEVLDGPSFEEEFNALRCIRGKRKASAPDRPFARMHIFFELVRGDRWSSTGSTFRPKKFSPLQPFECDVVSNFSLSSVSCYKQNSSLSGRRSDESLENLVSDSTGTAHTGSTLAHQEATNSDDNNSTQQQAGVPDHVGSPAQRIGGKRPRKADDEHNPAMAAVESSSAPRGSQFALHLTPLSLTAVIDRLAREGQVLRWDAAWEWYEVQRASPGRHSS